MRSERQKLVSRLDHIFSRYIRLRVADEYGYADCFTCDKRKHWTEVDAGHFITRAKYLTRWDAVNVQFQCKACNMNGGRQWEFGQRLDAKYGEGTAQEIKVKSERPARYSLDDLRAMISLFQNEVEELQKFVG